MEARQVSSKLKLKVLSVAPVSRTTGNCLILLQCHQVKSPSNSHRSSRRCATLNARLSGVFRSSFTFPFAVLAVAAGLSANAAGTLLKLVLPSSLYFSDERYAIPIRVTGVMLNSVPTLNPHASPSTEVLF